jgi:hypothetical protein
MNKYMEVLNTRVTVRKIILRIILYLVTSFLVIQDIIPQNPFTGVDVGSKAYYKIQMNSGMILKARIVSVDPDKVLLLLPGGESMTVPANGVVSIKKQSYGSVGSVGLGFGIPYGVFGANFDLRLFSVLYAGAGIGTGIFVNPMYNIGLKCYLLPGNYKFRPRILANYGTASMLYLEDSYGDVIERRSYNSVSLGAGFQYALSITKAFGFDADVIYIVNDSALESRMEQLTNQGYDFEIISTCNFKVSLGIRYVF